MDILTPAECQAIMDDTYVWEAVSLTKADGGVLKFQQASIDLWKDTYPLMLHECIMKYEVGDFCSTHRDSPWRIISPDHHAVSTWITPLNDGYDGGELYVNGKLIEQVIGVPIKLSRTTPHEITKVTNGTRYSQVSWLFVENEEGSWWDENKILGE